MDAARRGERFIVTRTIIPERRHWMAAMQGIRLLQGHGCAYVHTDGSITMLQNGKDTECKCGVVHRGV